MSPVFHGPVDKHQLRIFGNIIGRCGRSRPTCFLRQSFGITFALTTSVRSLVQFHLHRVNRFVHGRDVKKPPLFRQVNKIGRFANICTSPWLKTSRAIYAIPKGDSLRIEAALICDSLPTLQVRKKPRPPNDWSHTFDSADVFRRRDTLWTGLLHCNGRGQ